MIGGEPLRKVNMNLLHEQLSIISEKELEKDFTFKIIEQRIINNPQTKMTRSQRRKKERKQK